MAANKIQGWTRLQSRDLQYQENELKILLGSGKLRLDGWMDGGHSLIVTRRNWLPTPTTISNGGILAVPKSLLGAWTIPSIFS
jgi:hypothetical protein